jgi:hypothetical protein
MADQGYNLEIKHQIWLQKLNGQKYIILDHLKEIESYTNHDTNPYGEYAEELQSILQDKLQKVNQVANIIQQGNKLVTEKRKASELEISYAIIDNLMNELDTNFESLEKWFAKIHR